ncbi:MAG: response regulator [Anaerolineae bacterium]|nr:response regulator [Anaerolineae bacterium]
MAAMTTILIVDDMSVGRETLAELLLSPDYQMAFASNGPEALAKAAELAPDLILLDVMMPQMDGFEVCRRLRADPHLAEVPVVMVTALDDRSSRLQGLEAGADDFISKPFDQSELHARVHTITRLNRYRHLLTERTRFEWVVEQTDDGYLLLNNDDDVLYANTKARLLLGFVEDPNEPLTEKFLAQAQKQYHCEPAEVWAAWPIQSTPHIQQARYLVRPETTTAHACWLQATLLDHPTGLANQQLIQLRDVTAQVHLQRDRRTFHDMLSHKLRTPLAHIVTSLELLGEEETSALSGAEIVKLSRMALKGARRLRVEIEDILRYLSVSRLAQGETSCALAELPELVAEISADLGLAPVTLLSLNDTEQLQLTLSRRALEWILWEVLENTKKFHPQQTPRVEISICRLSGNKVSLKIGDDGLTLSPEQLAQAWAPYYQGEKYFTGEVAGMGLGLTTVASLVWAAGGTARLYNRKGGPGVVVELTMPVTEG